MRAYRPQGPERKKGLWLLGTADQGWELSNGIPVYDREILGTRIGRYRGLAVFSPGGEQQHLAIYRGDVDVENLGVVLHFVEADAVRIGMGRNSGSQQFAQILDRF